VRDDPLEQVLELLDDGHSAEALSHLDLLLREEPYQGQLYALRALIRADLSRLDDAAEDTRVACEVAPGHPFVQYAAGAVALRQGAMLEAIDAAQRARAIAPGYGDATLLEARARAALGQWAQVRLLATAVAEQEPGNEEAALLVTIADESGRDGLLDPVAWKSLVERFPLSSVARTGSAWTRLVAGEARAARDEFEQALALDPSLPWAKEGLVLALKASNPVYALLLRFFLWFGKLPQRSRNFVLIGGVLGYNFLRRTAAAQPELKPFIVPVLVAYIAFLVLSWLADPLLNLLLMARPEGRRLLTADDRRGALLVGGCLGVAAALGAAAGLTSWTDAGVSALGVGLTSFAVAAAYQCEGRKRTRIQVLAGAAFGLSVVAGVAPDAIAGISLVLAIVCVAASTWMTHFGGATAEKRLRSH
jgi:tetratricopeptide (TPR) repeat protein